MNKLREESVSSSEAIHHRLHLGSYLVCGSQEVVSHLVQVWRLTSVDELQHFPHHLVVYVCDLHSILKQGRQAIQ